MNQPELTHPVYANRFSKASIIECFEKYGYKKYVNISTGGDVKTEELKELQDSFPDHTITRTAFGYYEVIPK